MGVPIRIDILKYLILFDIRYFTSNFNIIVYRLQNLDIN